MSKARYIYTIKITLPNGMLQTDKQKGLTRWHAVEKSLKLFKKKQPDRTQYETPIRCLAN